jgi:hypothetical protein
MSDGKDDRDGPSIHGTNAIGRIDARGNPQVNVRQQNIQQDAQGRRSIRTSWSAGSAL